MSLAAAAEDLVTLVKDLPNFNHRVGLAVGGQEVDPINRDVQLPAAWVIYVGDSVDSVAEMNPCVQIIRARFVVKILIPYDNETNLINDHFPLLHKVVSAVRGSEPLEMPGSAWLYEGQQLESLEPSRQVWSQDYSIKFGV